MYLFDILIYTSSGSGIEIFETRPLSYFTMCCDLFCDCFISILCRFFSFFFSQLVIAFLSSIHQFQFSAFACRQGFPEAMPSTP